MVPHTPYKNATTFAFVGLCGDYAILVRSPHHQITTPRSATPIYMHISPWAQAADRSSAPRIEVGSIFASSKELRTAASKRGSSRMAENSELKTAVAARKVLLIVLLLRRPPRGEKGESQSRVTLFRSE